MNEDLTTRITERFSIEEIADACGITPYMFIQAFSDEIVDNLSSLSDIDHGFTTKIEDYE